jgi:RNA polymerase sigma-70 factor (ECF subfamily)
MAGKDQFQGLMRRVREGDQQAARELVKVYSPHILRVVRRRLHERLRTQFDSRDFEQEVWASFFEAAQHHGSFDRPEALVKYLVRVASAKVIDAFRTRVQTANHNPNRARSLDGSAAGHADGLVARQPTPSKVAMAREQWDEMLKSQPVHYRRMLLLLAQGMTQQQIADEMGINARTVRRVIEKLAPETLQ